MLKGRVIKSTGSFYAVETAEHGVVQARARGVLRNKQRMGNKKIENEN